MKSKLQIHLLKKIKFIKGLILIEIDEDVNSDLLRSFEQLFKIELEIKLEYPTKIFNYLENNNCIDALNDLNLWNDEIGTNLFKNPCDKNWYDLVSTENNNIKYCTGCNKNVFKVTTEENLIKRKNLEQCVAIDIKAFEIINFQEVNNFKSCNIIIEDYHELLGFPA